MTVYKESCPGWKRRVELDTHGSPHDLTSPTSWQPHRSSGLPLTKALFGNPSAPRICETEKPELSYFLTVDPEGSGSVFEQGPSRWSGVWALKLAITTARPRHTYVIFSSSRRKIPTAKVDNRKKWDWNWMRSWVRTDLGHEELLPVNY